MNSFMDDKETEAVEIWRAGLLKKRGAENLIDVVMAGSFRTCPDDCISFDSYGEACRCIRAVFSCPEEYELYKYLVKVKNAAVLLRYILEIKDEIRK